MKVAVTGGAGYIGSIVTRMLLDAGHQVVVLDDLHWSDGASIELIAALAVATFAWLLFLTVRAHRREAAAR